MIKKYWVYALFIVAVIVFGVKKYNKRKGNSIEVKTKQTPLGWAYEIYVRDTIFISQDVIPSITGRKAFKTEVDAQKVGDLMVVKMKLHQIPDVTEHELDSLKIIR